MLRASICAVSMWSRWRVNGGAAGNSAFLESLNSLSLCENEWINIYIYIYMVLYADTSTGTPVTALLPYWWRRVFLLHNMLHKLGSSWACTTFAQMLWQKPRTQSKHPFKAHSDTKHLYTLANDIAWILRFNSFVLFFHCPNQWVLTMCWHMSVWKGQLSHWYACVGPGSHAKYASSHLIPLTASASIAMTWHSCQVQKGCLTWPHKAGDLSHARGKASRQLTKITLCSSFFFPAGLTFNNSEFKYR